MQCGRTTSHQLKCYEVLKFCSSEVLQSPSSEVLNSWSSEVLKPRSFEVLKCVMGGWGGGGA